MAVSYGHVRHVVHKKIREIMIEELARYSCIEPQPSLWAYPIDRNDFIKKTIYLVFYKAEEKIGYGELRDRCMGWYGTHPIAQNSFEHNVKAIRTSLAGWYKDVIILGTLDDWAAYGREITFNNEKFLIHLLADSCDFRTTGPPGAGGSLFCPNRSHN
jgi:hypothetical protein